MGLINRSFEQIGQKAVIIIDEYDAPLLNHLDEPDELAKIRKFLQEFYQTLKSRERDIRFAFLTGITKFSQLSIFSTLNNLKKITMLPEYEAICGITKEELQSDYQNRYGTLTGIQVHAYKKNKSGFIADRYEYNFQIIIDNAPTQQIKDFTDILE